MGIICKQVSLLKSRVSIGEGPIPLLVYSVIPEKVICKIYPLDLGSPIGIHDEVHEAEFALA